MVKHRFDISNGNLRRVAWVDRKSGVDLLRFGSVDDFQLLVDGHVLPSSEPGWQIEPPECEQLTHGELQLRLELTRDDLRVVRYYLLHPHLSLVRGWLEITKLGAGEVLLADPPLASFTMAGTPLDLKWMSGAEAFGDSWRLRTERLGSDARTFDSYDPPPKPANAALPGDGIDARITLNGKPIWPELNWSHSAHSTDVQRHELTCDVQAGDQLAFVVARNGHMNCDTTEWDPVITYADGERFQASAGFSTQQGEGGWSYVYFGDDGTEQNLSFANAPGRYGKRWRLKLDVIEPFISETELHPDPRGSVARRFTAPRDGQISIQRHGSKHRQRSCAPVADSAWAAWRTHLGSA